MGTPFKASQYQGDPSARHVNIHGNGAAKSQITRYQLNCAPDGGERGDDAQHAWVQQAIFPDERKAGLNGALY